MKKFNVFKLWAPTGAAWAPWVKPVLFASLEEECKPAPLGLLPGWIRAQIIEPLQELGATRENHPIADRRRSTTWRWWSISPAS